MIGFVLYEATSVVCGAALIGAQLDPVGVLLPHWGPLGCDAAPARRYMQAIEPEPASQVSEPVTGGLLMVGARPNRRCAGLSSCWRVRLHPSSAVSWCWRSLCQFPGCSTPVGVDSVPRVVAPHYAGYVLAATGQWVRKKCSHKIRKRQATVGLCQLEPRLECKCVCAANAEVGAVSHEQLATHNNGGKWEEREAQFQQWLQEG